LIRKPASTNNETLQLTKKYKKLSKRVKKLEKQLTRLELVGQKLFQNSNKREISTTPVEHNLAYAKRKLGFDLRKQVPGFETHYMELQSLISTHGKRDRDSMPVIHWSEVKKLQRALVDGHLDVRAPFNERIAELTGSFPTVFDNHELADLWRTSGLQDGNLHDDKIDAELVKIPVNKLIPIQAEIFFKRVIKKYRKYGLPNQNSAMREKTLVISRDNEIIDGHHRFAAFYLVDPVIEIAALRVDIRTDRLLSISRSYGASI
jgi:hypothetical protein